MVRDPVTGRRLHKRSERNWQIEVPDDYDFDIDLLPTSNTYRYLAEKAARDGVQLSTAEQIMPRAVDEPLSGQVAVMPMDERAGKYERPLVFSDFRPGRPDIIYINAAAEHLEEIKDRVDEMRHYGEDAVEQVERIDLQSLWQDYNEILRRAKAGRKTFGAQTRGLF